MGKGVSRRMDVFNVFSLVANVITSLRLILLPPGSPKEHSPSGITSTELSRKCKWCVSEHRHQSLFSFEFFMSFPSRFIWKQCILNLCRVSWNTTETAAFRRVAEAVGLHSNPQAQAGNIRLQHFTWEKTKLYNSVPCCYSMLFWLLPAEISLENSLSLCLCGVLSSHAASMPLSFTCFACRTPWTSSNEQFKRWQRLETLHYTKLVWTKNTVF